VESEILIESRPLAALTKRAIAKPISSAGIEANSR
jgi:hypothetical protein